MSWLPIPLPNPFKSLQFDDEEQENQEKTQQNDEVLHTGGVKEDLTTIGETIGRQFRAFLSPETSNYGGGHGGGHGGSDGGGGSPSSSRTLEGIRSDLEEIKGTFKSSLSLFSSNSNRAVSEISKFASYFLKLDDDENDGGYVKRKNNDSNYDDYDDDDEEEDDDGDDFGVDDEVIDFAQQISNRPELWTDFPLSFDHELDLSEAQYEHVSIIEQFVPSLADLRSRINSNKSEKQFWMIYFVLLLPRLNEGNAKLLSTPETVEARETLLKMFQAQKNEETDSKNPQLDSPFDTDHEVQPAENTNASTSIQIDEVNESDANPEDSNVGIIIEERGKNNQEEEKSVITGSSAGISNQFQSEDDVSFSDLEDDDNDLPNRHLRLGPPQSTRTSSLEESNDWVRLNKDVEDGGSQLKGRSNLRERDSEGEDSTGWLTVDFNP